MSVAKTNLCECEINNDSRVNLGQVKRNLEKTADVIAVTNKTIFFHFFEKNIIQIEKSTHCRY